MLSGTGTIRVQDMAAAYACTRQSHRANGFANFRHRQRTWLVRLHRAPTCSQINDAGVGMPVGADEPLHKRATWSSLGSTTAQVEVKRLASGHSPKTLPSELLPQRRLTSSSPCLNVTAKSRWKQSENRNDKHSTPFVHVAMIVPPGSAPRRGMLAVGEYFIKHSKPEREYASNGEP